MSELSGMLASAVLKVARDKLVAALGDATTMPEDQRRQLEELKGKMESIAEVLGDAERRSIREEAVREWLIRLEDAAYGIWDMVDDLQLQSNKVIPVHRPSLPIAFARKGVTMASAMSKAKQNLDLLQHQLQSFALKSRVLQVQSVAEDVHPAGTSLSSVDDEDSIIVGRSEEKREMEVLLHAAEDSGTELAILSIVGMGGTGKTTLAKMVFSDASILRGYTRAWVHVGSEFDLKRIGNCILSQLLPKVEHHDYSTDMDLIMKRLDGLLGAGGEKLLLVLDDIWSTDLEGLQLMLGAGKKHSKVIAIVTTRSLQVTQHLGGKVLNLGLLTIESALELLQRKVGFTTKPEDARWQQILYKIADMCMGAPLAINALGYTLRFHSLEEIISMLNSELWKIGDARSSFFQSLLLSYQWMPPNLRLCFTYCTIFPTGHNILKDDMINHWLALQLIQPLDRLSTMQLANKYIQMLLGMSFLQPTMPPSDDRSAVSFTMHDLVHDLAIAASLEKSIAWDGRNSFQHFSQENSYQRAWITNFDFIPPGLLSAQLRALCFHSMNLSDDAFSSAKYLHVLDIRDCWLQKLPDSICQLRQLRYLNLSGSSRLVKLPDSFGNLLNLGHIDLSRCSVLSKLPASFTNLTSVVHIDLSGCIGLKSLVESFGNLKNVVHVKLSGCVGLKTLPESFGLLEKLEHLDLSSCSCLEGIPSVLGRLSNLQHLNLSHPCCYAAEHRFHLKALINVWVNLISLRYLNLSMCLNPIFCYQKEKERTKYIESISCLTSLEHLDLSHNIFLFDIPEKLGELSQLQTLNLSGCVRLKTIDKWMGERKFPTKFLAVNNCLGLQRYQFVVRTDGGAGQRIRSHLAQLKDVSCKEVEISCLEKIKSTEEARCIKLIQKTKLQKLTLVWSVARDNALLKDEDLLAELVPPHNLQCFELHGYSSEYFPDWLTSNIFSHLPNLVEITMVGILSCSSLPPFGVLPNLQRLVLRGVAKITRIDVGHLSGGSNAAFGRLSHVTLDSMVCLEELDTYSCRDKFVFPTLDELVVKSCPRLRWSGEYSAPKVRMLVISDCDQLMMSPEKRRREHEGSSSSTSTGSAPVTEVVIEGCKVPLDELKWSLLKGLAPLHSLYIRDCSEKIISEDIMKADLLSSLQLLCFSHCNSMAYLPEHVVPSCSSLPPFGVLPNLQRLVLRGVAKITRIDVGHLSGGSNAAFGRLSHVTLDSMVCLEELDTYSCRDKFVFPTLDELVVKSCPRLRWSGEYSAPKVRMLVISDCDQLMMSPEKRRREHEGSSSSTSTGSAPVTEVVIEGCKVPLDELKWSLLEGLAPLHSLYIRDCSEKIISEDIMKADLLSSLQLLCFSHCNSMAYLPEHVVQDTCPRELVIHECRGIKSLPQRICENKHKHYPLLRIRECPELRKWCELEENKKKLAHVKLIFEESGTSEAKTTAHGNRQVEPMLSLAATAK